MEPRRRFKNLVLPPVTDEAVAEFELGPAMSQLSEKTQKFVMSMVESGGIHYAASAIAAGFCADSDRGSARSLGWTMAHDEKVQNAIREVGLKMLNAGSVMAVKNLLDIAANGPETKDRLKAIEMILNRTGLHATTEHKVNVTHASKTTDQTIKEISQIAKTLGIDPVKLLGSAVVEGTFEEVATDSMDDDNDISGFLV